MGIERTYHCDEDTCGAWLVSKDLPQGWFQIARGGVPESLLLCSPNCLSKWVGRVLERA